MNTITVCWLDVPPSDADLDVAIRLMGPVANQLFNAPGQYIDAVAGNRLMNYKSLPIDSDVSEVIILPPMSDLKSSTLFFRNYGRYLDKTQVTSAAQRASMATSDIVAIASNPNHICIDGNMVNKVIRANSYYHVALAMMNHTRDGQIDGEVVFNSLAATPDYAHCVYRLA
ncbi:MAG: hypothetical protein CL678_15530 [Bdellovibrionaceae bacterium]|nr:hypothetical protein [Pseudobdellovibrionaceae bacterium]